LQSSLGSFLVHARCEKAEAEAKANVNMAAAAVSATNLTLPSHALRILELAANDGGKSRVRFAPAT
jgi:hypothetical protein